MKIVADKNIPFIEGRISGAELTMLPAAEIDREAVRNADALIVRTRTKCNAELLKGSSVRLVATATIGTDHIDAAWCESNGITVRNAPGCNAPGVALYVWSSLLRNGFDPENSTLGIIGYGHVGSIVADWGRELGGRIHVCDPPRKDSGLTDIEYLQLEEVLRHSDAVTLHTPLTKSGPYPTYHLIGEETLKRMKPEATLVNAARGEVISTGSVTKALKERRIGKVIIDTWEREPEINREMLRLADVATCHIAGYSREGKQRATRAALEAVRDCLGISVDLSGLALPYTKPSVITKEKIIEKYNPGAMTAALKQNPEAFETLRNTYPLHCEL